MSNVRNLDNTVSGNTITLYPPVGLGGSSLNTSTTLTKIAAALNRAQRNIGSAAKGSSNPFFKSRYADLGSVMEACKESLNEQGISVLQPVVSDSTGDYVETVLLHESGEYMASRMKLLVAKPNMQELGSAISYARRYGLQSMVFIPAIDDDGEVAMRRTAPAASTPAPAKTTPAKPSSEEVQKAVLADIGNEQLPPLVQPAVEPLKKSSFKKPKKVEATTEETSDWS